MTSREGSVCTVQIQLSCWQRLLGRMVVHSVLQRSEARRCDFKRRNDHQAITLFSLHKRHSGNSNFFGGEKRKREREREKGEAREYVSSRRTGKKARVNTPLDGNGGSVRRKLGGSCAEVQLHRSAAAVGLSRHAKRENKPAGSCARDRCRDIRDACLKE